MAAPLQKASAIFLLAAKFMCAPELLKQSKMPLQPDTIFHDWNPKISVSPPSILQPFLAK